VTSDEGKARLLPAVAEANAGKIEKAAMVVVFAIHERITDEHLQALLDKEQQDGRFIS